MVQANSNYDEEQLTDDDLSDESGDGADEKVKARTARPHWYAVQVASGCEKKGQTNARAAC